MRSWGKYFWTELCMAVGTKGCVFEVSNRILPIYYHISYGDFSVSFTLIPYSLKIGFCSVHHSLSLSSVYFYYRNLRRS